MVRGATARPAEAAKIILHVGQRTCAVVPSGTWRPLRHVGQASSMGVTPAARRREQETIQCPGAGNESIKLVPSPKTRPRVMGQASPRKIPQFKNILHFTLSAEGYKTDRGPSRRRESTRFPSEIARKRSISSTFQSVEAQANSLPHDLVSDRRRPKALQLKPTPLGLHPREAHPLTLRPVSPIINPIRRL